MCLSHSFAVILGLIINVIKKLRKKKNNIESLCPCIGSAHQVEKQVPLAECLLLSTYV